MPSVHLLFIRAPDLDRRRTELRCHCRVLRECARSEQQQENDRCGNTAEDEELTCREIDHRAHDYRRDIRRDWVGTQLASQQSRDTQITHERDKTIEDMEVPQSQCQLRTRAAPALAPGPALMPDKIVQHGRFDRHRSREQIRHAEMSYQNGQDAELNENAERTDPIEGNPALNECVHNLEGANRAPSGSPRRPFSLLQILEGFRPILTEEPRERAVR
jgi:hypothetical protein